MSRRQDPAAGMREALEDAIEADPELNPTEDYSSPLYFCEGEYE